MDRKAVLVRKQKNCTVWVSKKIIIKNYKFIITSLVKYRKIILMAASSM